MSTPLRILLCRCALAEKVDPEVRDRVLDVLARSDALVTVADDLCGLSAVGDPILTEIASAPRAAVIACHPRAVRWLFASAGLELDESRITLHDMRSGTAEEIIAELDIETDDQKPPSELDRISHMSEWPPWFPVIDRERCVNCGQCLNFCLFGTYALSDGGQVEVRKPAACKNLCPACARICPRTAIIFPKYDQVPINGAEVPQDADGPQVDLEGLKRGDVYRQLRDRSGRRRFAADSPEADSSDMAARLDIPREVLDSMSPEEVRRICNRSDECDSPQCGLAGEAGDDEETDAGR